jgi:hypothetical protein
MAEWTTENIEKQVEIFKKFTADDIKQLRNLPNLLKKVCDYSNAYVYSTAVDGGSNDGRNKDALIRAVYEDCKTMILEH